MRPPRPGSAWTPSRWARRGRYADYVNSKAWAKRRRRWFREHWERTHELAVCVVCGARPVDLHHMDYGDLGNEDYDQLIPMCRRTMIGSMRRGRRHHTSVDSVVGRRRWSSSPKCGGVWAADGTERRALEHYLDRPSSGVPFWNT